MARLPKTKARLSTSITIRAVRGDLETAASGDAQAILDLATRAVVIGAVLSFAEENPRGTTPRYELDADRAGEMVERTPGLADNTLTLNRVVLYESDILAAFGFTEGVSILDQDIPFLIVKEERAPEGSNVPTRTTIYEGCWFHNLPKNSDITGDLRVIQNVEVGYTRKTIQ
jgi:hypothetical protein